MYPFFDSDLNLYLQTFRSFWLTGVMLAVSAMGSRIILVLLALLILTAINFKKGLVILQLLLISFVLTGLLKELFGHPRPTEVELSLTEFAELLPYRFLKHVQPDDSPGFPSGHVLSTVVFWISVAYFFRGRVQKLIAAFLIILMPVSRMYLGRHYLGDVLGGLLIGTVLTILFIRLVKPYKLGKGFLNQEKRDTVDMNMAVLLLCLLTLSVGLNFLPLFGPEEMGLWFGFNLFCFWMIIRRLQFEDERFQTSCIRFVILISIYLGIEQILSMIDFPSGNRWVEFATSGAPLLLSLFITDQVFTINFLRDQKKAT